MTEPIIQILQELLEEARKGNELTALLIHAISSVPTEETELKGVQTQDGWVPIAG